jgi:hypothetical protein
MQTSPYNNPMLAQGLSSLVQSFIGNASAEASAQEAASRALLNNQTAQFRDAIGDTGLSGDLASMMIRALQAGPDYSDNAPDIGTAAVRMGAMGFGSPQLTPNAAIAQLMLGGGRRSGGGGGSAAATPAATPTMSASDMTNMLRTAEASGIDPNTFSGAVTERLASGDFTSAAAAMADALASIGDIATTTQPEAGITRLFGLLGQPDPVTTTTRGIRPYAPRGQAAPAAAGPTRLRFNPATGEFE